MRKLLPIVAFLCFTLFSKAQGYYDSAYIEQRFRKIEHITNILRDFRIKAFVQPEWQRADTAGIGSVQGGNFPAAANNRFLIRWGRLVLQWQHEIVNKHGDTIKIGQFSYNGTFTERGFGGMYEFYGRIIDPWTGWFGFQGGIFAHQFGFEAADFTDVHESPEASRVNQMIFPYPSDLGMEILIESPRTFKPFYLRLDAGLFNGASVNVGSETGANQNFKDFDGRLWMGRFWKVGSGRIGFNASVSFYDGAIMQTDSAVYEVRTNTTGQPAFVDVIAGTPQGGYAWKTHVYNWSRQYYGFHAQVNFEYKLSGANSAFTMLRGEYIAGTQPGQFGSPNSNQIPTGVGNAEPVFATGPGTGPSGGTTITGAAEGSMFVRKFNGWTVYASEGFHYMVGKQLMHTDLTFKCDFYNPNTAVSGSQILPANNFSAADVSWTTVSGGVAFVPVQFLKIFLWYDHVMNESAPGLTGTIYTSDYKKNDVFTIRTQFTIDSWWWDKKTNNPNLIAKTY